MRHTRLLPFVSILLFACEGAPDAPVLTDLPTPAERPSDDFGLDRFRTECANGNQESCYWIGAAFEHGHGGSEIDIDKARQRYEQACAADVGPACNDLGALYGLGKGVARDDVEAARLYEKSCDLRDAVACQNLAAFYVEGTGVLQDPDKARSLYELGCELGEPASCRDLGHLYVGSDPPDYQRARVIWQQGCDEGFGQSCADLGFIYIQGLGVPKDEPKGVALMSKGCDLGYDHVCQFVQ